MPDTPERKLMLQQLKEFKYFLKRFKEKEDTFEAIFEARSVPTEEETREFEKMKTEYQYFMKYFSKWDFDLWDSEIWTPRSVAAELVRQILGVNIL